MNGLGLALLLSAIGGVTIPLGAALASFEYIRPRWLKNELRHGIIAFGGGVLLAAVSLVLVPEGTRNLPLGGIVAAFGGGGVVFFLIDRAIERHGGSWAQMMAMLLDFVPEAIAMGALLATGGKAGLALALFVALQNLPEGFNAYRELRATGYHRPGGILGLFSALALLGPLAALTGFTLLSDYGSVLGALMLFSAGGIIYLTFEDIAPQAVLKNRWAPPLGAVLGYLLGIAGDALIRM